MTCVYCTTEREQVLQRLHNLTRARRRAETALQRIRADIAAAMYDARRARIKQKDVVAITGYDREHIRRMVHAETARRDKAAQCELV